MLDGCAGELPWPRAKTSTKSFFMASGKQQRSQRLLQMVARSPPGQAASLLAGLIHLGLLAEGEEDAAEQPHKEAQPKHHACT